MKAHEGFIDGVEGIAQNAKEVEAIIDAYVTNDAAGVASYGQQMSNDDAVKVFEALIDMRRVIDRAISYWAILD